MIDQRWTTVGQLICATRVMLHHEINFFSKTRYDIWKYYSFPSKSIFNRSNIFFLFREIVKLISLAHSSIYRLCRPEQKKKKKHILPALDLTA